MGSRRFEVPLYYKPLVGDNPKKWIEKVMDLRKKKERRPLGLYTLPLAFRKLLVESVVITKDHSKHRDCQITEEDTMVADPRKLAKCLISKPTITQMGQTEEKVYCGMMYGPDFTEYEQKSKKRTAKTLQKMLIKQLPKIDEVLRKNIEENRKAIKKEFKVWLEKGKNGILQGVQEELKQKELELKNWIIFERKKALLALKGQMEREAIEVNERKKEYLKEVYEFQKNWILKEKEQQYINRMNIYSSIWNKILYKLKEKANKTICELNRCANQSINESTLKDVKDKLEEINNKRITNFQDEVQSTLKRLKAKVLAEELEIEKEKSKRLKIKSAVDVWNSLLVHLITLFDEIIVTGFKGKPGECNYFLSKNIVEKLRQLSHEIDEVKATNNEFDKQCINKIADQLHQKKEEISVALSYEKSYLAIDMFVNPPDKDLIIELNLFQVKKLIKETTCEIINKPLQISEFMRDESIELTPFNEEICDESSYLLNKLSDAYCIIQKMLTDRKRDTSDVKVNTKDIKFTIDTDPELTKRVDSLIKIYRKNPDNIKALTNV